MEKDELAAVAISHASDMADEMMITLLDQSQDCIKLLSPDGSLDFMNRHGRCSMEIDDFLAIRGKSWWELWPDESAGQVRDSVQLARGGESSRFEAFCPTAKGAPRWWEVSVSPVRNLEGKVSSILSISRDITERVQARESAKTMAMEMRHRLRNAFAVSGAITLASGREEPDHKEFASRLSDRFNALSRAQTQLLEETGRNGRLPAIVRQILEPYLGDPHLTLESIADVAISEPTARMLSLLLGELATNSVKHGALRHGHPLSLRASNGNGDALTLEWQEEIDLANDQSDALKGGSGIRLMTRMASIQGAEFDYLIDPSGLKARLVIPADRL